MISGRGLERAVPQIAPWRNLFALPDFTSYAAEANLAADWYFAGLGPTTPTQIPYSWLVGPLRQRQDSALNAAAVSRSEGGTAYSTDQTSIDEYGQWPFSATLTTDTKADAQNLADWVTDYFPDPRTRFPALRLILNKRTPTECWTILAREVGDRITITDTPTGWPLGGTELVIEGIGHSSGVDLREVVWSTAPVIGTEPDSTGPWVRWGVTNFGDETDAFPF
jgi:hypothetical protein